MLGIRLEFTMDEFFAKGGVTTFTDRMAAVLGIQKADLKVVSVYEGSTIVEFQVIDDPEAEVHVNLQEVKTIFDTVIKTVSTFMDSPILSAVADGSPVLFGDESQSNQSEAEDKDFSIPEGYEEYDPNKAGSSTIEDQGNQKTIKVLTKEYRVKQPEKIRVPKLFIVSLGIIIAILAVTLVLLCFYNKLTEGQRAKSQAGLAKKSIKKQSSKLALEDSQYKTQENIDVSLGVSDSKQYVPKSIKDADLLFVSETRERSAFVEARRSVDHSESSIISENKQDSTQSVSDPTKPQSAELEKST